jgi:hypothetical protein
MAPLPPNSTRRYFLNYTVGGLQHTLQMRTVEAVTDAGAAFALDQFMDILSPALFLVTINNLERANLGSNIRNVIPWTGNLTYGIAPQDDHDRPNFISFVGRSPGGRRVRATVFGWNGPDDANYRYVQGENVQVDNAYAHLNLASGTWIAVDGQEALFHLYGNYGFNAYWQRAVRP